MDDFQEFFAAEVRRCDRTCSNSKLLFYGRANKCLVNILATSFIVRSSYMVCTVLSASLCIPRRMYKGIGTAMLRRLNVRLHTSEDAVAATELQDKLHILI